MKVTPLPDPKTTCLSTPSRSLFWLSAWVVDASLSAATSRDRASLFPWAKMKSRVCPKRWRSGGQAVINELTSNHGTSLRLAVAA